MPTIDLYTTSWCPYCARAKKLLDRKGAAYTEINLDDAPERRGEMVQRAGGKTSVPQIFIEGAHVGGCDDLYELDYDGKLDPMLAG